MGSVTRRLQRGVRIRIWTAAATACLGSIALGCSNDEASGDAAAAGPSSADGTSSAASTSATTASSDSSNDGTTTTSTSGGTGTETSGSEGSSDTGTTTAGSTGTADGSGTVTSTEGQTEATDSDTQTTTTGTDETSTGTPTDTGAGGAGGATGAASEDEPTEDAGAGGMGGGTAVDPDDMATGGQGGMQDEGNGGEPGMDDPTPEVSGGASAAAICEAGASYGDPLEGMGQVIEIGPPTMGDVTYFAFIEGPIWHAGLQTLFFSDNASSPQERIFSLTPPSETPEVFMDESGSNGLALDNDDLLLLADQRNKRIVRVDPNTAMVIDTVVPEGDYTPNDLIMRSDDNLYFTDPNSAGRGFYRVSPEGQIDGPFKEVGSPNGILLSTDETTLYVGDVQNRTITAFAVAADGSVDAASATLFATTTGNTVDGMATDCAGNLYASTAEGVEVFAPDGSALGSVPTGESSNATFGGTDRKTLYVTSRALLKAVTLGVPGLPN